MTFFEHNKYTPDMAQQPCNEQYLKLAQTLISVMGENYQTELLRQQALKEVFVFPDFNLESYASKSFSKGTIASDMTVTVGGTSTSSRKVPIANVELKNDLGKGDGCNANYESIGYYLHFSSDFLKQIGRSDLAPMLLITIVGNSYMQAFGGFRNSRNEPCVDPISHPVSLISVYANALQTVNIVARFLESMCDLISALRLYYQETCQLQVVPNPQGFPFYSAQDSIAYIDHICRGIFRGLYCATDVVIKFISENYGLAVHQHLAEKGLAPRILHHQTLGLGWTVVVMELIPHTNDISSLTREQKFSQANAILAALKEKNYVHGDLRLLLGREEGIVVVDFI